MANPDLKAVEEPTSLCQDYDLMIRTTTTSSKGSTIDHKLCLFVCLFTYKHKLMPPASNGENGPHQYELCRLCGW